MKQIFLFSLIVMTSFINKQDTQGLKTGDKAPLFEAKSHSGDTIKLSSVLENGPVVLFFYRGAWCPYCNRQISELQDSLKYIYEKGASVIAVTPEIDTSISKTIGKTHAVFPIIHDEKYKIMNDYNVSFKVDNGTVTKYKLWGINLEKANGNEDNILPVPATYVIGKDGIIKYAFFNTDYKKRASVKDILSHL